MNLESFGCAYVVLGMSGKMGVGKNYVSDKYLVPMMMKRMMEERGVSVIPIYLSFALFLKSSVLATDTTNEWTYDNLFCQKTKASRTKLQTHGLAMRTNREDVFIRYVHTFMTYQLQQLAELPESIRRSTLVMFIVQDVRFQNELNYVQSIPHSVVVRVHAPARNQARIHQEQSNATHVSETQLDDCRFEFDGVIFNDPVYDFTVENQCDPVVQRLMNMV